MELLRDICTPARNVERTMKLDIFSGKRKVIVVEMFIYVRALLSLIDRETVIFYSSRSLFFTNESRRNCKSNSYISWMAPFSARCVIAIYAFLKKLRMDLFPWFSVAFCFSAFFSFFCCTRDCVFGGLFFVVVVAGGDAVVVSASSILFFSSSATADVLSSSAKIASVDGVITATEELTEGVHTGLSSSTRSISTAEEGVAFAGVTNGAAAFTITTGSFLVAELKSTTGSVTLESSIVAVTAAAPAGSPSLATVDAAVEGTLVSEGTRVAIATAAAFEGEEEGAVVDDVDEAARNQDEVRVTLDLAVFDAADFRCGEVGVGRDSERMAGRPRNND